MDVFSILRQYVPIGFQSSADDFIRSLATLNDGRYNQSLVSIEVARGGIEIFDYTSPKITDQQFYKWSDLKNIINSEYPPKSEILNQLNFAF